MHNTKRKLNYSYKILDLGGWAFCYLGLSPGDRVKYVCVGKSKSKHIFNVFESLVFSVSLDRAKTWF